MSDTDRKPDQEKGDEVLRRLLKTPPDPKNGKDEKRKGAEDEKEDNRSRR